MNEFEVGRFYLVMDTWIGSPEIPYEIFVMYITKDKKWVKVEIIPNPHGDNIKWIRNDLVTIIEKLGDADEDPKEI